MNQPAHQERPASKLRRDRATNNDPLPDWAERITHRLIRLREDRREIIEENGMKARLRHSTFNIQPSTLRVKGVGA